MSTMILNHNLAFAGVESCTEQLKTFHWPTDCLLGLKLSKAPKSHINYKNLDKWCALNSEKLAKTSVTKIFVSLSPPPNCLKQAEAQLRQNKVLTLLKGEFLNSFL